MHKFDAKYRNRLDSPSRREILPVDKILNQIGLESSDKFADIGCGIGYFSIPAAEIIGSDGYVYALDFQQEMIEEVNKRIEENHLSNIYAIVTDEYDLKLNDASISLAFMSTVLHEIEDRIRFLKEIKRIMTEGGKIAIVEWIKRESEWGPPLDHKLESDYIKSLLQECGFKNISVSEINDFVYLVIAIK